MRAAIRSVLFSAIQGIDLDFVRGRYASNSGYRSDFLSLPGATYTRAGAATAETAAGVVVNFAANVPRITDRGVLIEEARTNLFPRSAPTAAQMSFAQNVASATEPASPPIAGAVWNTLTNTASTAAGYQLVTVAASSVYTMSVLCETPDGSQPVLGTSSGTGDFSFIETNIVVPTSTIYTRLSGNTWRVAATFTSGASSNQNTGIIRYTTQNQRVLKFSGFQLEAGAFPTSYIPTTGAAATRARDIMSCSAYAGLNYPLTLFAEVDRVVDTGSVEGYVATSFDGSNFGELFTSAGDKATCATTGGGSRASAASVPVGSTSKIAGRCETNNVNVALNGTAASADVTATMPSAPVRIELGVEIGTGAGSQPNGYIRRASVYPRAFSDAELQALTT